MKKLHLLSNAHLDPVWQWQWEEGAAAAVSTFRAAADFCEQFEGYVFNHNEAILYQWIEEYEPELFERIRKLVASGKWHIMGGWYLQPDCNMPSGESMVRQILAGRTYFREKFGEGHDPTTAINFDPFGHSQGLVQILNLAGFDSYIFMRPDEMTLPAQDFIWKGFNGSSVMAHKVWGGYNCQLGKSVDKIVKWMDENADAPIGLVLWGVGNHGGGPSRVDLKLIAELQGERKDFEIVHSTPETYFAELAQVKDLPAFEGDLNPRFVGCYTSQIRIKQKHRKLENELFMTEKMLSTAALEAGLSYPYDDLQAALRDLLTSEFHDILPGSSVQSVEETSLRGLDHGLEILSKLKARAFFALAAGQPAAEQGEYPILVYNPHPYPVRGVWECEFMLEDQNWKEEYSMPIVYKDGVRVPSQPEKEDSNLNLDWRKKVVFEAELPPMSMNRFECRMELLAEKPSPALTAEQGKFVFQTDDLHVVINALTGLIDEYAVDGINRIAPGACVPLVVNDNGDPWRMDVNAFRDVLGRFQLMPSGQGTDFSGVDAGLLPSVRVIEDGEVRTVIEALFFYRDSQIVQTYKLPKQGSEIEIHVRVFWNEKDKLLKWSIPTSIGDHAAYRGQTMFGVAELPNDGHEAVAQKWVAAVDDHSAFTVVNDGVYGSDFKDGEIRMTLLRSPAYCAHPILDRPLVVQDRFLPRMDQGERQFTFWLNAGNKKERLEAVDREALAHGEKPFVLSFFPSGLGELPGCPFELEDEVVQLTTFKREERGDGYILRLFEPTGQARETAIILGRSGKSIPVTLSGFEVKTLRLNPIEGTISEVALLEQ
ncbi:alpha-mannosidase [Paenibacillus sp. PAMC21692]|uniref:glycoside hydrolase family 38 N-terminal domain-containing protein n=1 Tax=Paenibacillus sp. PAMC21692 TaxID=2762320 RepID=UPI00164DFD02|nr:alpha-mannosidase [Paenibacillus sp. PAMC21692]QNK56148.1 alpha-mannosidase [Paenibacillus sp. PAMC21692]